MKKRLQKPKKDNKKLSVVLYEGGGAGSCGGSGCGGSACGGGGNGWYPINIKC